MISIFKITYFQPWSEKMHHLILTFLVFITYKNVACKCCPVGTTNKIDISWFRNVNPSKESMFGELFTAMHGNTLAMALLIDLSRLSGRAVFQSWVTIFKTIFSAVFPPFLLNRYLWYLVVALVLFRIQDVVLPRLIEENYHWSYIGSCI